MSWVDRVLGKIRPEKATEAYVPKTVWAKPGISQEQFAEVQQTDNFPAQRRVVAQNNRRVTRDYGHGPVDETTPGRHDAEGPMLPEDLDAIGAKVKLSPEEKDRLLGGQYTSDGYEVGRKL